MSTTNDLLTAENAGIRADAADPKMPGARGSARGLIVGLLVVIIAIPLVLTAFVLPASRMHPHDLPIGIAAPPAPAAQVQSALDKAQPGAFAITRYDSRAELINAVRDRDIYGGIVAGPTPVVVIATGANPQAAQLITQIGNTVGARSGAAPTVLDVAPPPAHDARGLGFGNAVIPLFIASIVIAMISTTLIAPKRTWGAAATTVAMAAVGAAMAWLTLGPVLGVFAGNGWAEWAGIFLTLTAIGLCVQGLVSIAGYPGIGISAILFMLIGVPLAGVATPPEFLPSGWATLGQALPLGAGGNLLRGAAFFAGAGTAGPALVLLAWAVIGMALVAVGNLRRQRATAVAG